MKLRRTRLFWTVAAMLASSPALASARDVVGLENEQAGGDHHAGRYVHSEMELASGLWLKADGTFEYWLTVGSLDETARGRWTAEGDRIVLVNDPAPVPPIITPGRARLVPGTGFGLRVTLPTGQGVEGVNVVVGFDQGEPAEGYTQTDGWTLPGGDSRKPRWVQLSMPAYGLSSPRFPVDTAAANAVDYVLTPNDFGVVDLRTASVTRDGDALVLNRGGQGMRYERQGG